MVTTRRVFPALGLIGFVVVLIALSCSLSFANVIASKTTQLLGSGAVGDIQVYSQVDEVPDGSAFLYTYTYTLTYLSGTATAHDFGIDNPNDSAFFNASNTPTSGGHFVDPVYVAGSYDFIEWNTGGSLPVNGTDTFSYQSLYKPQDVDVYAFMMDGGSTAQGEVIGMSDVIPEPSALAALALGILAVAPKLVRRPR